MVERIVESLEPLGCPDPGLGEVIRVTLSLSAVRKANYFPILIYLLLSVLFLVLQTVFVAAEQCSKKEA